jgi:hypothetical protein
MEPRSGSGAVNRSRQSSVQNGAQFLGAQTHPDTMSMQLDTNSAGKLGERFPQDLKPADGVAAFRLEPALSGFGAQKRKAPNGALQLLQESRLSSSGCRQLPVLRQDHCIDGVNDAVRRYQVCLHDACFVDAHAR